MSLTVNSSLKSHVTSHCVKITSWSNGGNHHSKFYVQYTCNNLHIRLKSASCDTIDLWNLFSSWNYLQVTVAGEPITRLTSSHKKPYESLILGRYQPSHHGNEQTDNPMTCPPQDKVIVSVPCILHSKKPPLEGNLLILKCCSRDKKCFRSHNTQCYIFTRPWFFMQKPKIYGVLLCSTRTCRRKIVTW